MKTRLMRTLLMLTYLLTLWAGTARAAQYDQPPMDSPFNMTGFIQAATLDNPADVLSGGTVTVNGTQIVIPKNTIVIMSASNISWQEVFAFAPCPWGLAAGTGPAGQVLPAGACATGGNGQSGVALSDAFTDPVTKAITKPLTTYEVTIAGNRIIDPADGKDKYVAGLVFMAQHALNLGQGVINFIDYATGTLHVGCPTLGAACPAGVGARVQINDPVGRYGRKGSPDPRFTADTDNPTIRAQTGYPMCIPRAVPPAAVLPGASPPPETDSLCPQRNRPLDPAKTNRPLGNFTLCNPGVACLANAAPIVAGIVNARAPAVTTSDATNQAPFQVGDFIAYSGTIQKDATGAITGAAGGEYLSAWQIIADLGIYTAAGAVPAYLAQELLLQGVGGTPINAPLGVPQEQTIRIKTRGFFTDPTRTVDLFSVAVDPCSGFETESVMLLAIPQEQAAAGAVPWGRFRQVDQFGLFPISRQWRVRYTLRVTDPIDPTTGKGNAIAANGLNVMQFTAPVSTFLTPENTVYGDPTLLAVPQNFQDFPFLAKGEGPWRGDPAKVVGQLAPFPLTNSIPGLTPAAPAPFVCPAASQPTVTITPREQTVTQGSTVTLDASASHSNPTGHALTFQWQQNPAPTVTLAGAATAKASFTAPAVTVATALSFQVTVTDTSTGQQSLGTTLVQVTPVATPADTVLIAAGGVTYRTNRGVLNATVTSSDSTCSAILTLTAPGTNLPAGGVLMTPQGIPGPGVPCTYNFVSGKQITPAPTTVTVTSSLGGSATATVANGELRIR
jgi:hypothetical protein